MTPKTSILALALGLSMVAAPAYAEAGDYSGFRAFWNLFFPPAANAPVDAELRDRLPIELIENPGSFDDGFDRRGYLRWQTVQLHASTGAICGDGSPFEFYVNRSNQSSNMVVFFEGGGACWDQETCDGGQLSTGGIRSMLPELVQPVLNIASIANTRVLSELQGHPLKTQDWTFVFVPYCGQDVHFGNAVRVYDDVDPSDPLVVHHRGANSHGAVITWLKSNLERPAQVFLTGQSAGGFGTQALYHPYRVAMEAQRGYLLNDSGPVMPAPQDAALDDFPSIALHATGAEAWGVGELLDWFEDESVAFDANDLSTSADALSELHPGDRLGLATAQEDHTISGFSYNLFFEEIFDEPELAIRDAIRNELRFRDTPRLRSSLDALPNFGYFAPGFRDLAGGHVLTIPIVTGGARIEQPGPDVDIFDFFEDILHGSGRVMEEWEASVEDDYLRYNDPANLIYRIFLSEGDGDIFLGGGLL